MTCCQIQFAIDDPDRARAIVTSLLERRLIACGQCLGPMASQYWWKGSCDQAQEWLILMKTTSELADTVVGAVVDLHPYDTPEVVVGPIVGGNPAYLQWIQAETGSAAGR